MTKKETGVSGHLLNIGLLVCLAYVVTLPGGPLRTRFDGWRAEAHLSDLAEEHWATLAATSARMNNVGAPQAAMVIEFGDYECPFCRQSHAHLATILETNPHIAVGFRHYPLTDIHPKAEAAARAAICAEAQGRFEQVHSLLFESTEWQEADDWKTLAEQAGVADLTEFSRCLSGDATRTRLEEDIRLADVLQVTATPTFFYKFGAHVGYANEDQLLVLIESSR